MIACLVMPVRRCSVTITDMQGEPHTVEVAASTLFSAIAGALKEIPAGKWKANGFIPVKVRVLETGAEYEVKLGDFTRWLDRRGNTPREVIDRKRIREILGLARSASL
jgi:hypothetical protein